MAIPKAAPRSTQPPAASEIKSLQGALAQAVKKIDSLEKRLLALENAPAPAAVQESAVTAHQWHVLSNWRKVVSKRLGIK